MNLLHPDGQDRPTRMRPPPDTGWAEVEHTRRGSCARIVWATVVEVLAAMQAITAIATAVAQEWLVSAAFTVAFAVSFGVALVLRRCGGAS